MSKARAMAAMLVGAALALGQGGGAPQPGPAAAGASRFEAVDVYVDSGAAALAAYQVDLKATTGTVQIVGIEGGEAEPYSQPPYYDPRAMQHERVILAALSTAAPAALPTGLTRVARVHVQITGPEAVAWECRLVTAGGADGGKITATAEVKDQGASK